MLRSGLAALAVATAGLLVTPALAADLRAAPVTLEPIAGARTTTLTLINEERRPVQVQLRALAWSQQDGQEQTVPTDRVTVSPPITTLKPGEHYLIRLVRTADGEPVGEEAYRVLVDEVPDPTLVKPGSVNLVLRQSIPAFFSDIPKRAARVEWAIARAGNGLVLIGRNTGTRRIRLADVKLTRAGQTLYARAGLVGYVLAGAEMHFPIAEGGSANPGPIVMTAQTDAGPLEASIVPAPGA